jgi:hypothetical protein
MLALAISVAGGKNKAKRKHSSKIITSNNRRRIKLFSFTEIINQTGPFGLQHAIPCSQVS